MTIPLISTLLFWAIDAYYLMLERAFRNIYNAVASKDPTVIDYSLTPAKEDKTFRQWIKVLFRPVLVGFYGIVLIMLVILLLVLNHVSVLVTVKHGT